MSLFSHFPSIQKTGWLVLLCSPYEMSTIQAFAYKIQTFYLYYILDQPVFWIEGKSVKIKVSGQYSTLHLGLRSVMCNGAEENQAHCCNPYGLRVQEQPLFLVCSSITIFTPMDQVP